MKAKESATDHRIKFQRQIDNIAPDWLKFLGGQPNSSWELQRDMEKQLSARFKSLNIKGELPGDIRSLCRRITRGIYLSKVALDWNDPQVGHKNPTGDIRGEQWRVAMAWAGLETILKATVCSSRDRGIKQSALDRACTFTDGSLPAKLAPPSSTLKRLKDARKWPKVDGDYGMLDYLDVGKGFAASVLDKWLCRGKPLTSTVEIIGLAQAVRHATAHGALSATTIKNWGMTSSLSVLTVATAGAACGLLNQLCDGLIDHDSAIQIKSRTSGETRK